MTEVLSRRALNRATLERQLLLRRADMSVTGAVEHLVGLQAQTPHTWYGGLWTRLAGFRPEHAADLLVERKLVRIALMRGTIHLVTPADCLGLRPLVQPLFDRVFNSIFARNLVDVDRDDLVAATLEVLRDGPQTFAELGRRLAERWPDSQPASLAQAARAWLALVQVPPRGVWGRSGPIAHTTARVWLGAELDSEPSVAQMILRYLRAFGPATVKDVQTWCGLTRLREVVDGLRPQLVTFRDEQGRELFDLPDAPRPDADTPAPARFLYDYDNLLLSHADRSRVATEDIGRQNYDPNGPQPAMVLVDGFTAGDWKLTRDSGKAMLTIRPFNRLSKKDVAAVEREGAGFVRFLAPDADTHDVRVT